MDKKLFDIPVLLIAFNRPETTCHVFDQIRKIKPAKLYIFSDAPRVDVPDEHEMVETCRCLFDESQINWECKVERWFPETNMGCAIGVSSAITWAFETCEKLIILEDDCLPHASFFTFSKFMLDRYDSNDRVMHVAGTLRHDLARKNGGDHAFSPIGHVGAWATWKRAWEKYDFWMEQFPEFKTKKQFQRILANSGAPNYWNDRFDKVYAQEKKSSWEAQWQYTIFKNYGVAAIPNVNLISNIDIDPFSANAEGNEGSFIETKTWTNLNSEIRLPVNDKYGPDPAKFFTRKSSDRAGLITRIISLFGLILPVKINS